MPKWHLLPMSYMQNFGANPMTPSKASQIPYMITTNMQTNRSAAKAEPMNYTVSVFCCPMPLVRQWVWHWVRGEGVPNVIKGKVLKSGKNETRETTTKQYLICKLYVFFEYFWKDGVVPRLMHTFWHKCFTKNNENLKVQKQ